MCERVTAPEGLSTPLVTAINSTSVNISWRTPSLLNGPRPLYTVRRVSPAFNYPPQHVEFGTRFTGAGYYRFPPNTIPQGVTFTGLFLSVSLCFSVSLFLSVSLSLFVSLILPLGTLCIRDILSVCLSVSLLVVVVVDFRDMIGRCKLQMRKDSFDFR